MDSRANLLENVDGAMDSRDDIEFVPIESEHSSRNSSLDASPDTSNMEEMDVSESTNPLTKDSEPENSNFKDRLSFALSVFNLMNAILGSGILGLAEALKNLGIFLFIVLLLGTALLASYTINVLLHMSQFTNIKTYEGLARLSFGMRGKVATSIMIILHCLGAICSYIYIIKTELPEVIKVFADYHEQEGEDLPIYLNGSFLVILVVVVIIVPLASMKDIKFLGYSSAFGMMCMLFFTITVVVKKFSIPCPLTSEYEEAEYNATNLTLPHSIDVDDNEEQYCEGKVFALNARSAYAVPTMVFSFMCHASMLPIYVELRRPSIGRMQKVAFVSIFNVFTLYMCAALFGYFSFFNKVQSELLLTYSLYNSKDTMILLSRMMVIICVTLSIPLLHYPARKTVILTMCKNPHVFSWIRHMIIMIIFLTMSVVFVMFVPNIRDIFGMAGATTSTSLLVVFPSAFFIKLTGEKAKSIKLQKRYAMRRKVAWVMAVVGTVFMIVSITLIFVDWFS